MMRIVAMLALLAVASPSLAAPGPEQTYEQANQAYFDGDYLRAKKLYQRLLEETRSEHPAILLNLGNCAHSLGKYGVASYYFRKAAREGDDRVAARAQANLEVTRKALLEKYRKKIEKGIIRYDESHGAAYALFTLVSPVTSGAVFLAFSLVLFVALFTWTFSRRENAKTLARATFLSALAPCLAVAVLYFGNGWVEHSFELGVVIVEDARLLDAPSTDAPGEPLPEGLETRILTHNEAGFYKVELSDGKVGYATDSEVWPLTEH